MSVLTIRAHRRYAMRLPVDLAKNGGKDTRGLLIELSQQGARISNLGKRTFEFGEAVTLTLECGHRLTGSVRWAHDGLAGIRLDQTLHAPEMRDLLIANRDAQEDMQLYGT